MKSYFLILAFAASAFGAWQDDVPQAARGDTIRTLAWLSEATATRTNSDQRVVFRDAELVGYEQTYRALMAKYNLDPQGNATSNEEALAVSATFEDYRTISKLYLAITKANGDFSGLSSITNNTMLVTPTHFRWEDCGFTHPPDVKEIEEAK